MWDLLGLDHDDESVYRHYASFAGSTTADAVRVTGLTEDIVRTCQRRLVECGLLYRTATGEVRPTPAGPATVAARLRDELEAEDNRRRRQLGRFADEMTQLVERHVLSSSYAGQPMVDRIPSSDAAAERLAELLATAQEEVARSEPGIEPARRGSDDLVMPAEIHAVERGVDVRAIYPPTLLVSPAVRRVVNLRIRAGVSVRTTETPATSLTIIDRRVAVLVDHRRDGDEHTFLVREGVLVHTLHHLFETTWMRASDVRSFLADAYEPDDGEVNGSDRMVLWLLGEGLKDEAVAKRLGISVRTLRRKIFDLSRRLSAESRFQAGVRAARRHWV